MNLLSWSARLRDGLRHRLGRLAMRYRGHGIPESDVRAGMESIYRTPDPWGMDTPREQFRFRETDRILRTQLVGASGRVPALLEIGSGEGHQSIHLRARCERLTCIDVVGAAVERARTRVPDATFVVGNLRDQPWADAHARFDIVTACEVLYAFTDIPATLATMSRIGRACLVTWHAPAAALVDRPLARIENVSRASFAFEGTTWHAAWWR